MEDSFMTDSADAVRAARAERTRYLASLFSGSPIDVEPRECDMCERTLPHGMHPLCAACGDRDHEEET
jgi:hypothetical protein